MSRTVGRIKVGLLKIDRTGRDGMARYDAMCNRRCDDVLRKASQVTQGWWWVVMMLSIKGMIIPMVCKG